MMAMARPGGAAVRPSSTVFRAIRLEVFSQTQESFGKKFQMKGETVCRMENQTRGYRVSKRHLRVLRELRAPRDKAELFQSLLAELEAALRTEAGEEVPELVPGALPEPREPSASPEGNGVGNAAALPTAQAHPTEEAARQAQEAAHQAQESAVLAQQLGARLEVRHAEEAERAEQHRRDDEGRRAEEARKRDEAVHQQEALIRRAEQVFQAATEWWAQQVPRVEDALHQVQAMVSGAEQRWVAWWAEELKQFRARADAEAQQRAGEVATRAQEATDAARLARESAERAEQTGRALLQRVQRWVLVGMGASVLALAAGGLAWVGLLHSGIERSTTPLPGKPEPGSRELARQGNDGSTVQPEQSEEPEDGKSQGQDGGSATVNPGIRASPMPKNGVPGQRRAPCPGSVDVFDGNCWGKVTLSPEQVQDGMCDDPKLYEPSEGWCAAHHAAYRPYLARRPRNAEKK